ncbi:MAG: hypothetical protein M1815_000738 [Lichina confinis]|nr:MAG: hypothetical protein M1815_000738 [Lichina confinis]
MSSSNRRQRQGAQRYEPFGSQSFQVHDTSQAESTSFAVPEPVQGMQLMTGFQGQHDFPNTVQPSARESTLCPQLASLIHSLSPEQVTLMRELLHDQAVSSEMTRSNSYQTATSTTAEESSVPVSMWRGSIPHRPGVQGPIAFESVSGTDWTAQGHLQTPAAVEGDPALAGVPDRCNNGYDYNTMAVVALTSAQSVPDQNYQEVDNRESIQASSTYQNYPAEPGWWNGTTSQAVHDTAGGSATWLGSPVPAQASAVGVPQSSTYEGLGMTMQPPR